MYLCAPSLIFRPEASPHLRVHWEQTRGSRAGEDSLCCSCISTSESIFCIEEPNLGGCTQAETRRVREIRRKAGERKVERARPKKESLGPLWGRNDLRRAYCIRVIGYCKRVSRKTHLVSGFQVYVVCVVLPVESGDALPVADATTPTSAVQRLLPHDNPVTPSFSTARPILHS